MNLREHFVKASNEIAENLDIGDNEIKFGFHETPKIGLDYTGELYIDNRGFHFHLRTVTKVEDPYSGKMTAFLTIYFDYALPPFTFHENIDYLKGHPNFLCRWVFWAIYNFRLKHQTFDLETVFNESIIRVYGEPGYGADAEISLILNGMLNAHQDKVIIYKFGHVDREDRFRRFSYAFLVNPKYLGGAYLAFFPMCAGLDSGGSYSSYKYIEECIQKLNKKFEVEIRRFDIDYKKLKIFLLKNAYSFFNIYLEDVQNIITIYMEPNNVLKDTPNAFSNFVEQFERENYPQALRDLRALIQQAEEDVLREKRLVFTEERSPSVLSLAQFLIENDILEGRLLSWFQAFTSIANLASHREFPTIEDLRDSVVQKRILLTFKLGVHLLKELDEILLRESAQNVES